MLFAIVSLLVITHQLWLWHQGWRFNALSPYFLCDVMMFSLLGIGSLVVELDFPSIYSEIAFSFMVASGIIAYYLGLHMSIQNLKFNSKTIKIKKEILGKLTQRYAYTFIMILLIIGIFLFIYRMISTVSLPLSDLMTLSATKRYAELITSGFGAFFSLLIYIFVSMTVIEMYFRLVSRKYLHFLLLYFLLIMIYLIISSTRVPLLSALLVPVAFYHYRVKSVNIFLVAGLFLVAPILLTVSQELRSGSPGAWNTSDLLTAELIVLKDLHLLWSLYERDNLQKEYFYSFYYWIITFIPRQLWSEKPLTAFENRWTQHLYGSQLHPDGYPHIHTFTPWGEGLVQFGIFGVVLNLFLYGACLRLAIRFFSQRPHTCIAYFLYSILTAVFIRTSTQALVFTTAYFVISVLLYERLFLPREAKN